MVILSNKSLLLISSFFQPFVRGQVSYVKPFLKEIYALRPIPFFHNYASEIPYFNKYFTFLRAINESNEQTHGCIELAPKYFTLPLESIRRRNYYLTTRCCIRMLSKKKISFDLIHAHFLNSGFIGVELKKLYGTPLVVTAHGGDVYNTPFRDNWYNSISKYVIKGADMVITVSKFNAEILSSLGISSKKLHIIYNGYDEKIFKLSPQLMAKNEIGLPKNKKIVLSIGNLVDIKGHVYLIEAMKKVIAKRTDVLLFIIGSGVLEEVLRQKILKLGLSDYVFLVGRKPHEEIPVWLNASDLFVLPSLGEGFPTVIPEAMACGKPVIGTAVGGVPEIVSNSDVGLLVKPKDSLCLADSILTALEIKWKPELINSHSKQYAWDNVSKQIIEVYQNLLT